MKLTESRVTANHLVVKSKLISRPPVEASLALVLVGGKRAFPSVVVVWVVPMVSLAKKGSGCGIFYVVCSFERIKMCSIRINTLKSIYTKYCKLQFLRVTYIVSVIIIIKKTS